MPEVLKQIIQEKHLKKLSENSRPKVIEWSGKPDAAKITFHDKTSNIGSCIRCHKPPCIEYDENELRLEFITDFPADMDTSVCPTGAITWPKDAKAPTIGSMNCIMCGICINRCPTRAIYFGDMTAIINDAPNNKFIETNEQSNEKSTNEIAAVFKNIPENGPAIVESGELLKNIREKIQAIASNQTAQFPNHIARNLLISLGFKAAMRRRGDTNVRIDVLFEGDKDNLGVVEVEFANQILEAPRDVLDDIAVMHTRYNKDKNKLTPLILAFDLPNQRSEYWQFIKDVKNVLHIKINSLTLTAAIMLVWNRSKVSFSDGKFYIDIDNPSLKKGLVETLGRELVLDETSYGRYLQSEK